MKYTLQIILEMQQNLLFEIDKSSIQQYIATT